MSVLVVVLLTEEVIVHRYTYLANILKEGISMMVTRLHFARTSQIRLCDIFDFRDGDGVPYYTYTNPMLTVQTLLTMSWYS